MRFIKKLDVNYPGLVYVGQELAKNMQKKTMRARKSGNTSIKRFFATTKIHITISIPPPPTIMNAIILDKFAPSRRS